MRSEQPDKESNPILNQLKILKEKLNQRGSIIQHLSKELARQKAVTIQIIEEFRRHESVILTRLQKLEDINIKYIKDYLMIKQKMDVEDFSCTHSIVLGSAEQLFAKKCQQFKQQCFKSVPVLMASSQPQLQNSFITSCTQLLRTFLLEKQPKYQKITGELREERRRRLKEVKGIDGFKKNLEEQKLIEAINSKAKELSKKVLTLDRNNLIEVFNLRTQLEREIAKLSPQKIELSLNQSQQEQKIYERLIQEIIMANIGPDDAQQQIVQQFIMGQYQSLEKGILFYSEEYGKEYIDNHINGLKGLTEQTKASILNNESYYQLAAAKNKLSSKQASQQQGDQDYPIEYQYEEEGKEPKKKTKKKRIIKKKINSKGQQEEYEQIQQEESNFKAKTGLFSSEFEQAQDQQNQGLRQGEKKVVKEEQEEQIEDSSQMLARIKSKKKNEPSQNKTTSKLHNAYETATTKSFFQQQQKARDSLIAKQTTELKEHQKVIDKLITFIKKEFKDKKLEQIEGDDPEQLMGYYFRVNNKKYVDIKEEIKELSMEKKKVEKQFSYLREEKLTLQQEKSYLSKENQSVKIQNQDLRRRKQQLQQIASAIEQQNLIIKQQNQSLMADKEQLFQTTYKLERDNQAVREQKIALQEIRVRLQEEKGNIQKAMLKEQQALSAIIVQRDNLAIKLELQQLQILALSEIYQNIKANTKQWQQITVRTQNVVKLSLETLFNTCLNKMKPEELIVRLQNLIDLIKVNMQLKKDMTFELSVLEYVDRQEQRVKKQFTMKVNEIMTPQTSEKCEIKLDKVDLRQLRLELQTGSGQQPQKPKTFAGHLQDLAFQIIEKSISSQDQVEEDIIDPQFLKEPMATFNLNRSEFEGLNSDILLPLLSFFKPKPPRIAEDDKGNSNQKIEASAPQQKGLDQNFIDSMMQRIQEMKFSKFTSDQDMKQMFEKYKQALDCLQRAQKLNQENEMKYQEFLRDLKAKGAKNSPQSLEEKLFYMERVIATQNQLIENQRVEFQETIMKQVEKSEELAQDIIKNIKLKRKQTHI